LFTGSANTFGYSISNWDWNFGDVSSGANNVASIQNPSHNFVATGSYSVQLIVQNNYGCKDTVTQTVSINSSPITNFTNGPACKNSSLAFTDNSTIPLGSSIGSSFWNFANGTTSPLLNASTTFLSAITYNVMHVITLNNGCKDTLIKPITVNTSPTAYFTSGNICANSSTQFNDISVTQNGTITGWQWHFGTTATATSQNPQHTFTTTGNVAVELVVTANNGCKDSITQTLVVNPKPNAAFTFNPSTGSNPVTVNFTNTSTGAISYNWNFGDGNQSTLTNPVNTFNDTGTYQMSLIAVNNFGCSDTANSNFIVVPRRVDVAILDFSTTFQNNYLDITAQLKNKGTVDVTTMDLYVQVNNGPVIKEKWTGNLTGIMLYPFNTSMNLEDIKNHYICIEAKNPNSVDDEYPLDNSMCKAIDISGLQVIEPFPNPSNGIITLPIIIPEKDELTITLTDARGKIVQYAYSGLIDEGLQMITIYTEGIASGIYACKIEYKNSLIIKKIIKN